MHEAVQLALCIGTPSKDITLNDTEDAKRGFCRPIDVRPDLVTPYKDYVTQVSEKVNNDGSIKAKYATDRKFSATRAFMTAVFNGNERSPPSRLDIELPCYDGWSTPLKHRSVLADEVENEDEQHDAEEDNGDSKELFERDHLPPAYKSVLHADTNPDEPLTNANAVALFDDLMLRHKEQEAI